MDIFSNSFLNRKFIGADLVADHKILLNYVGVDNYFRITDKNGLSTFLDFVWFDEF